MREMHRLEQKTERALQLFDERFRDSELDVWVFIVEVFRKLGNALSLQKGSELLVVGGDAIVDNVTENATVTTT
jgi:hypothetical protein